MGLSERDRKHVWHPFTQEKTCDMPIAVKKGSGSYLYDVNDKKYLDLVSSWWVNIHGHGNQEIAKAIYDQACNLEHVIFAGFTHEPAVNICEMLHSILPEQLTKFFFSDNGSTAVEVALKLTYQYWMNQGITNKNTFLCFEGAYHGDTLGSMSVGIKSGFHKAFQKLLLPVKSVPFADTYIGDPEIEEKEKRAINELNELLEIHGDSIVAFILEPLIQGAGGMRMCRPQFVDKMVNLARQYNIFIIFDEIMTGFGRTGTNFAFQQTNVIPDFLCLSKGLTGGFLPLSLTVTTNKVYNMFLDNSPDKSFKHGHSYTANPIGCAAAIASLKILTRDSTKQAIEQINRTHTINLPKLQEKCSCVNRIRVTGTVAAFDISREDIVNGIKKKCLDIGIIIRPLDQTIYLLPPYCTTKKEIENTYNIISDIILQLCSNVNGVSTH